VRTITVAEFRNEFRTLAEPVEVMRYGKVVGVWYPGEAPSFGKIVVDVAETEPVKMKMAEAQKIIDMQEDEIRQLKRIVAANAKPGPKFALSGDPTFTTEFRPVPKPGSKK